MHHNPFIKIRADKVPSPISDQVPTAAFTAPAPLIASTQQNIGAYPTLAKLPPNSSARDHPIFPQPPTSLPVLLNSVDLTPCAGFKRTNAALKHPVESGGNITTEQGEVASAHLTSGKRANIALQEPPELKGGTFDAGQVSRIAQRELNRGKSGGDGKFEPGELLNPAPFTSGKRANTALRTQAKIRVGGDGASEQGGLFAPTPLPSVKHTADPSNAFATLKDLQTQQGQFMDEIRHLTWAMKVHTTVKLGLTGLIIMCVIPLNHMTLHESHIITGMNESFY
jgi:hypothetical protein